MSFGLNPLNIFIYRLLWASWIDHIFQNWVSSKTDWQWWASSSTTTKLFLCCHLPFPILSCCNNCCGGSVCGMHEQPWWHQWGYSLPHPIVVKDWLIGGPSSNGDGGDDFCCCRVAFTIVSLPNSLWVCLLTEWEKDIKGPSMTKVGPSSFFFTMPFNTSLQVPRPNWGKE